MVPTFTCGFLRSNVPLAMRGLGLGYVWIGNFDLWISVGEAARRSKLTWSPEPDLNRRPRPYQGRALPTELSGQTKADEELVQTTKKSGKSALRKLVRQQQIHPFSQKPTDQP